MSGVAVTVIDARGHVTATTATDGAGRFHLAGMTPGQYTRTAAGAGLTPVAVTVALRDDGEIERDLELPRRARLLGTVTAAGSGRGVAEALTTLVDPGGTVVAAGVTDADGTFAFEDLAEGTYTVTARGYDPAAAVVQVAAGGSTTADVVLTAPRVGART